MIKITIAGASGYIGTNLVNKLKKSFLVRCLSRSEKSSGEENVSWRKADLFSLTSTMEALEGTDTAIYLVHSMMSSSRLFQGSFRDTDLILADNFVRACKESKVKQIIYLGGIVPKGYLSKHLESRKEVEDVLMASGIPCTIFRAGLVVGDGGSSFEILKNLVFNLPAMVLPKWTQNNTPVIFIDDLIDMMNESIDNHQFFNQTLNAVSGEKLSYKGLIEQTINHLNKKTVLFPVPINYTSFSKLWVSIFGESEYELTSPLIDSLLCDFSDLMPSPLIEYFIKHKSYQSMLKKIALKKTKKNKIKKNKKQKNNVRSIQRLIQGSNLQADEVAELYMEWLPLHMKSLIRVEKVDNKFAYFRVLGLNPPLLVLEYIPNPKAENRVKFHVIGGILSKTTDTGWLEFRNVDGGNFLLASINEFIPALPWYIYKFSQATAHKATMDSFGKFLQKKDQGTIK